MTAAARKGLGKGLEALLSDNLVESAGVSEIELSLISSNPYQPRRDFDQEKLAELAESIKEHGLIQPIIVRKSSDGYHIIAGERRVRAARMAGLEQVPALVKDATDAEMMQLAVVENIQRQDLNPVEEAGAYQRLMDEFEMTQEDVAGMVGKSRSAVANTLRIMRLPIDVLELVSRETLSEGHARALLGTKSPEAQSKLAKEAVRRKLSVRQLEEAVSRLGSVRSKKRSAKQRDADIVALEGRLRQGLGTKVRIVGGTGSGKIEIYYFSLEELDGIIERTIGS
ncbi:MAG TPA: ParB/RepB/Spo0J family partition protein [Bacillota bacterium]|nr:MAG: Chromosome-partitioning protein Spo0J [Firmicutes bacterium ADurb.Bin153]HNV35070.1 ParB/RepB/Spo0J family partition protein [Bacillota bacterium]